MNLLAWKENAGKLLNSLENVKSIDFVENEHPSCILSSALNFGRRLPVATMPGNENWDNDMYFVWYYIWEDICIFSYVGI